MENESYTICQKSTEQDQSKENHKFKSFRTDLASELKSEITGVRA